MESGTVTPIPAPPAVSADGGAAAAITPTEAAADAVAEMAKHLTVVDADDTYARPIKLDADGNIYSCKHCSTQLGLADDIFSKGFYCKNGKAYLFSKVVNVTVGAKEDRMLITGMHTISDIFCVGCGRTVGWKYESAHKERQKYKEGKFILERYMLSGPDGSNGSVTDEDDAHVGGSTADNV